MKWWILTLIIIGVAVIGISIFTFGENKMIQKDIEPIQAQMNSGIMSASGEELSSEDTIIDVDDSKLYFGYPEVTIKTNDVLSEKLLTAKLDEHMDECLMNCEDIQEIILYKDSVLIEDIRFISNNNEIDIPYNLYYNDTITYIREVPVYEKVCGTLEEMRDLSNEAVGILDGRLTSDAKEVCIEKIIGYENETTKGLYWSEYKINTFVEAGIYKIKIKANKDMKTKVDYQLKSQGVWMDEYAWWDAFTYYRNISGMNNPVITPVNGTRGLTIGSEVAYVYGYGQTGTNALYYTDVNTTAIGNSTDQTFSVQTRPQYKVTGTRNANVTNLFFFDNNGTTMRNSAEGQSNLTLTAGTLWNATSQNSGGLNITGVAGSSFTNNMKGSQNYTIATRMLFTSLTSDPAFWGTTTFGAYCQEYNNKFYCEIGGNSYTNFGILTNRWYSFLWTGNTTNNCFYVVNMTNAPTTVWKSCEGSTAGTMATGTNMYVGSPTTSSMMYGLYDEVETYNRTFTEAEAREWVLMNNSLGVETSTVESTCYSLSGKTMYIPKGCTYYIPDGTTGYI